jgi:hypothetical protein
MITITVLDTPPSSHQRPVVMSAPGRTPSHSGEQPTGQVWQEITLPDPTETEWRAAATRMATDLHAMLTRSGMARHDDHNLAIYERPPSTRLDPGTVSSSASRPCSTGSAAADGFNSSDYYFDGHEMAMRDLRIIG